MWLVSNFQRPIHITWLSCTLNECMCNVYWTRVIHKSNKKSVYRSRTISKFQIYIQILWNDLWWLLKCDDQLQLHPFSFDKQFVINDHKNTHSQSVESTLSTNQLTFWIILTSSRANNRNFTTKMIDFDLFWMVKMLPFFEKKEWMMIIDEWQAEYTTWL